MRRAEEHCDGEHRKGVCVCVCVCVCVRESIPGCGVRLAHICYVWVLEAVVKRLSKQCVMNGLLLSPTPMHARTHTLTDTHRNSHLPLCPGCVRARRSG